MLKTDVSACPRIEEAQQADVHSQPSYISKFSPASGAQHAEALHLSHDFLRESWSMPIYLTESSNISDAVSRLPIRLSHQCS